MNYEKNLLPSPPSWNGNFQQFYIISSLMASLRDHTCSNIFCPVCQFPPHPINYMLTGVCPESSIDRFFYSTSKNSDGFHGFIQTKMTFSLVNWRWEIIDFNWEVLAFMTSFEEEVNPLGLHPWYFIGLNCTDPGQGKAPFNSSLDPTHP